MAEEGSYQFIDGQWVWIPTPTVQPTVTATPTPTNTSVFNPKNELTFYSTGTNQDRINYFQNLGFKYVKGSGEAQAALWEDASGKRYPESTLVNAITSGKDIGSVNKVAADYSPNVIWNAAGQAIQWEPATNKWIRQPDLDNPTKAAGYVAPRVYSAQEIANINSEIALRDAQIRKFDADIKQAQDNFALSLQQLDWLKTKDIWAQETADKNLILNTQSQMFQQDAAVSELQVQMAGLQARRDEAQANLDQNINILNTNTQNSINQFNATMQFNVDQANEKAKQDRLNRLQSLASSIAEAAKAPGDYGKLAALTLANSGWGQAVTAIGKGADIRTAQSLAPTESLLRTREEVLSSPEKPFSYTPLTPAFAQKSVIPSVNAVRFPAKTITGVPEVQPRIPIPAKPAVAAGGGGGGGGGGAPAPTTTPIPTATGAGAGAVYTPSTGGVNPSVQGQQAFDYTNWEIAQQQPMSSGGGYVVEPALNAVGYVAPEIPQLAAPTPPAWEVPSYSMPSPEEAWAPVTEAGTNLLEAEMQGNYARGGVVPRYASGGVNNQDLTQVYKSGGPIALYNALREAGSSEQQATDFVNTLMRSDAALADNTAAAERAAAERAAAERAAVEQAMRQQQAASQQQGRQYVPSIQDVASNAPQPMYRRPAAPSNEDTEAELIRLAMSNPYIQESNSQNKAALSDNDRERLKKANKEFKEIVDNMVVGHGYVPAGVAGYIPKIFTSIGNAASNIPGLRGAAFEMTSPALREGIRQIGTRAALPSGERALLPEFAQSLQNAKNFVMPNEENIFGLSKYGIGQMLRDNAGGNIPNIYEVLDAIRRGSMYANGGVASGAYISGERGPELNIPLGDKTIILNQKQMKAAGIDLKSLMSDSAKPKQFADGGIFDQGWGNVTDPDRTLSMNFLNDALARARAGTPWQTGPLPSPVYASSPGFSPIVSQTLASLTAMGQGIPAEYFQELAARYRPAGVRESVTQRSA